MIKTQTDIQIHLTLVLTRLTNIIQEDDEFARVFTDDLENLLDEILGQDGFGTEGQYDPRGDFRDGQWSMSNVQGLDE